MDKVVDHLLVFKGQAEIKDFPGNYTQYREWNGKNEKIEKKKESKPISKSSSAGTGAVKLSFKEKRELESLEKEIPSLEAEQSQLEAELSSGTLPPDELLAKSQRISQIMEELDTKMILWLELSEKNQLQL
jgi:ATP-binding cassette subfamily F protein uup